MLRYWVSCVIALLAVLPCESFRMNKANRATQTDSESDSSSSPRCEGWCNGHGSFWSDKCGWPTQACSGCRECRKLPDTSVPAPVQPTPAPGATPLECHSCDDEVFEGVSCTKRALMGELFSKCRHDGQWRGKKYCQQSCYESGNGYDGDRCCSKAPNPASCTDEEQTSPEGMSCTSGATTALCTSSEWKQAGYCTCSCLRLRPNIVFVLIDDLGFNDFVNAPDMATAWKHTRSLLPQAVLVNSSYGEPVCAPTRSTLMAGRWRFQMGDAYAWGGVSRTEEIALPLKLRLAGYKTYAVGKWHVGYMTWKHAPAGRGFHRYYGDYENGDFWIHCSNRGGFDLHYEENDNFEQPWSTPTDIHHRFVTNETGSYKTELYDRKVSDFLIEHKNRYPSTPFFLYYSMYALHGPLEAPTESVWAATGQGKRNYFDDCRQHRNEQRQSLCAMNAAIDDAIANLNRLLSNIYPDEKTLLIMTGDNGGSTWHSGSNNAILRGNKGETFEGGIRNHVLVWGSHPDLQNAMGTVYTGGFMHLVDWHATMTELAWMGSDISPISGKDTIGHMDGVNMWNAITSNSPSPRSTLIWAERNDRRGLAYRKGDYKLVMDIRIGRNPNGPPGEGKRLYGCHWPQMTAPYREYRDNVCKDMPAGIQWQATLLYNIKEDPGENNDLGTQMPQLVASMKSEFDNLVATARYSSGTTDFECGDQCTSTIDGTTEKKRQSTRVFPGGGNPCLPGGFGGDGKDMVLYPVYSNGYARSTAR